MSLLRITVSSDVNAERFLHQTKKFSSASYQDTTTHAQRVTFRQEPAFRVKAGIAQSVSRIATTEFVAGVDHSELMVEEASKRSEPAISNEMVYLKQGDVARFPYEDDSFEKVFSVNLIYFVFWVKNEMG